MSKLLEDFRKFVMRGNVLDLAVWDAALLNGKVVTLPALREMWTATTLKGGSKVPYGYGWTIESIEPWTVLLDAGGSNSFAPPSSRYTAAENRGLSPRREAVA